MLKSGVFQNLIITMSPCYIAYYMMSRPRNTSLSIKSRIALLKQEQSEALARAAHTESVIAQKVKSSTTVINIDFGYVP